MKKPVLAIKAAGSVPAETMGKQLLLITYSKYGNEHIHDTFLVQCQSENNSKKYILQRINHEVFAEPVKSL